MFIISKSQFISLVERIAYAPSALSPSPRAA